MKKQGWRLYRTTRVSQTDRQLGEKFRPAWPSPLNCGTGSSFLNALVKAFQRLTSSWPRIPQTLAESPAGGPPASASRCFEFTVDECGVEDQLRRSILWLVGDPAFSG